MSDSDDLSSRLFLEQLKQDREEALRSLYLRHRNAVEAVVAKRLGREPEQRFEDTVQTIWLAVLKGVTAFEGKCAVRTWIIGIARNVCAGVIRDEARAARRESHRVGQDDELEAARRGPSVIDQTDVRMLGPEALAALGTLPAEEVRDFLAHDVDDKSFQEIADETGVPVSTIKSRVQRAREKLRGLVLPHESRHGDEGHDPLR